MAWPRSPEGAPAPALRSLLALAGLFALPVLLFGAIWLASAEHSLLPSYRGCSFVRERDAQIDCYSQVMGEAVREDGLASTLADVDRRAQDSTTLAADCHLAWHPIGEREGRSAAKDGASLTYPDSPTTCQRGYVHGLVIGQLAARPSLTASDLVETLEQTCLPIADTMTAVNCTHAVGHVIARESKNDQNAGVRTCDRADFSSSRSNASDKLSVGAVVDAGAGLKFQCMYGMYMEYGIIDVAKGRTQHNACTDAPTDVASVACYSYLPTRVGAIEGDLSSAAKACSEDVPVGQMRTACVSYLSYGFDEKERCTLFAAAADRDRCRMVIAARTGTVAPVKPNAKDDVAPSMPGGAPPLVPR
jgi:hypothetical protein